MKHHTVTLQRLQNVVKVEVDLIITNPITSNNFCNSLAELRQGSLTHKGKLSIHPPHNNQYQAVFTSCFLFFFSSLHPARSASSWQGVIFIYFRVILHEFVSVSLTKPCGFSHVFLTGIPLILFLIYRTQFSWNMKHVCMQDQFHVKFLPSK